METIFNTIFNTEDCVDFSEEFYACSGVIFKRDFGPWKQGDRVEFLRVQLDEARIFEEDEDGNEIAGGKSCKIGLCVVD